MRVQEAVKQRILDLAQEKDITINKLSEISGVSASTLKYTVASYSRVKNTGVVTIQKLCQGLGISFLEFFDCDYFENLDPEEEE